MPDYITKRFLSRWVVINNTQYVADCPDKILKKVTAAFTAPVIALNFKPSLCSYREIMQLTSNQDIAGFRRYYCDSAITAPQIDQWPHKILIQKNLYSKIFDLSQIPSEFDTFKKLLKNYRIPIKTLNIGRNFLDLNSQDNLLKFALDALSKKPEKFYFLGKNKNNDISEHANFYGPVVLGNNIKIDKNVSIIGPAVILDNVKIASGTIVKNCLIQTDAHLPPDRLFNNQIITNGTLDHSNPKILKNYSRWSKNIKKNNKLSDKNLRFRNWPLFSYPHLIKRSADILLSILILALFLPFLPLIAIAIKLNSAGPIFYRDKRQGLRGRKIHCLKFRTMYAGSDKFQDRLRFKNQVDGPQFKIDDDPRVTIVGNFLRNTFIDEIPQFLNVLAGQMSVVGPRPSPVKENSQSPFWRDARLSVKPGITGMWQAFRTRKNGCDFQEWIYYDIKYIRDLSLKLDLLISFKTALKIIKNFARQF